ncbi:MAG: class I SAM-dependent methyltransferase [Pyrodictiaceae archaeon]
MDEDIIQRLYSFLALVEESTGYLSPYAPTPRDVVDDVVRLIAGLINNETRQPILYEPGCGKAHVALELSKRLGGYTVCLEIDEELAKEAHRRVLSSKEVLTEVVIGDLRYFNLRRLDLVYAYLLSYPVMLLEKLLPRGSRIVSLDYLGSKKPTTIVDLGYHKLYVIEI